MHKVVRHTMIAAVIAGTGLALAACGGNTEAVAPAPETAAAATTSAPAAPSTTAAPAPAALDPANQAAFIDLNGAIGVLNPVIEKIVWAPTSDGKVVIGARMWRDFIGKQDPQSWVSQGYWVADNVAGTNAKALNEPAYVFSPKGVEQHDELYATYQADLAPLTSAVLSGALYR